MSLFKHFFNRTRLTTGSDTSNGSQDDRFDIYDDLHRNQITHQEEQNRYSAELILSQLFGHFRPASILDVGCGIGTWLAAARALGINDIFGVDGLWLNKSLAKIPDHLINTLDLEKKFDLNRRFDLVMCLEVAEHLSAQAAEPFVASLTKHADVILFSAAIPFQGGHHHVNEQFPDYWSEIFSRYDYQPVDFIRRTIWNDTSVLWWLRQNIFVFAKRELTTGTGPFAKLLDVSGPLSVVHPEVYMDRLRSAQLIIDEHNKLIKLLSSGGSFSVDRDANGQLRITAG